MRTVGICRVVLRAAGSRKKGRIVSDGIRPENAHLPMLILGVESSCDETGLALYDGAAGALLAHAVHSQVAMHEAYGGVVPELASRDHVRRLVPLTRQVLQEA